MTYRRDMLSSLADRLQSLVRSDADLNSAPFVRWANEVCSMLNPAATADETLRAHLETVVRVYANDRAQIGAIFNLCLEQAASWRPSAVILASLAFNTSSALDVLSWFANIQERWMLDIRIGMPAAFQAWVMPSDVWALHRAPREALESRILFLDGPQAPTQGELELLAAVTAAGLSDSPVTTPADEYVLVVDWGIVKEFERMLRSTRQPIWQAKERLLLKLLRNRGPRPLREVAKRFLIRSLTSVFERDVATALGRPSVIAALDEAPDRIAQIRSSGEKLLSSVDASIVDETAIDAIVWAELTAGPKTLKNIFNGRRKALKHEGRDFTAVDFSEIIQDVHNQAVRSNEPGCFGEFLKLMEIEAGRASSIFNPSMSLLQDWVALKKNATQSFGSFEEAEMAREALRAISPFRRYPTSSEQIAWWESKKGTPSLLPLGHSVTIREIRGTVRIRFLRRDDPLGVCLGYVTDCCQHLNGEGSAAAVFGHEDPRGCFVIVEDGNGTILTISLVWIDQRTMTVVFDSIEHNRFLPEKADAFERALPAYEAMANSLILEHGIKRVHVGGGRWSAVLSKKYPLAKRIVSPCSYQHDSLLQFKIAEDGTP